MGSFALKKLFSFTKSHLLIVDLSVCVNTVLFRKSFPVPLISGLFPTFSSVRFKIAVFRLRSVSEFLSTKIFFWVGSLSITMASVCQHRLL